MDRNREIQQKSQIIQSYFNKLGISKVRDLATVDPNKSTDAFQAFGSYRTNVESFTSIDQSRMMRYRQYEQMCYVPELNGGIELYSDDSSLYNEEDKTIAIQSDNQEVIDTLDELFFKSLDLNSVLWHITYNTCKYGDSFYEVIPDNFKNPRRIKYLRFIPPQFVGRKERDGNLLEFIVKVPEDVTVGSTSFTSSQSQEISLKPWQIVHFRLDDKEFEPYGKSVLEPGRLAFKQMKLIEDAMLIYRISRAPERRVFNIPVGNLTYREAMARVGDFQQRYRKTPWIDPQCLTLDSRIDLLDGRSVSLTTLIEEYKSGKENWVYSIDTARNNKMVPGKIEWAGITRKNAQLVEVFIDNGKSVRCTPDHKFMLRDGTYKEAKDLIPGESLMPKYTKTNKRGYYSVYDPATDKYRLVHSVVAENTQPKEWNKNWYIRITHHKDFKKINNNPNNLILMERDEHNRYHLDLTSKLWADDDWRAKQIASRIEAWANATEDRRELQAGLMTKYNKSSEHRKAATDRNNRFWADITNKKETSAKMRKPKSTTEKMHIKFDEKFWYFIDSAIIAYDTQTELIDKLNSTKDFISHYSSITPRSNKKLQRHLLLKAYRSKGFESFDEYANFVRNDKNHKVIQTVYISTTEDTGCITVENYHNFALNSEIFVKNSGEISYKENPLSINDDFFLPKRPDGSGVTIEYLPGGQQLGEIDDVRYFKEKILRTMRIPIAYLTGELQGDVAKTSLAAMDVRFAKTIERVQKQIVRGLEKIATIELAFKRFNINDLQSFILKLTPASKIYELQTLEMMTQRINVIQAAMNLKDEAGNLYLPTEWMYKNINHFTDQEISVIKLMQQAEAAHKAEIAAGVQAAAGGGGGGGGLTSEVPGAGGGLGGAPVGPGLEAGAVPGAPGPEAAVPPGGEIVPAPGGEVGGGAPGPEAATTPAAGGGGAELAVASQILNIAGKEFLLENESDIKKLIKYVKEQQENQKITKDKSVRKVRRKMYENHFNQLFIAGELKGLIRRKNGENNKKEVLED